jgi:hypothetical protein
MYDKTCSDWQGEQAIPPIGRVLTTKYLALEQTWDLLGLHQDLPMQRQSK